MALTLTQLLLLLTLMSAFTFGKNLTEAAHAHPPVVLLAFGDSTTDTGNAVLMGDQIFKVATRAPYGETYFKHATGRFSDGRLMLDFLCEALKWPLLPPHLSVRRGGGVVGENFAVAGATALDSATLLRLGNITSLARASLNDEVEWFKRRISVSRGREYEVVYFGEIGGNDYNYALAAGMKPADAARMVPQVVARVGAALKAALRSGVKRVIVQGEFPMGCMPVLNSPQNGPQDCHGCSAGVSAISERHNYMLKAFLNRAAMAHLDAEIVFFDTSAAYLHIIENAHHFNFTNTRDACFAGGLSALLNIQRVRTQIGNLLSRGRNAAGGGNSFAAACSNPENFVSWDGIHSTEAMHGAMMKLFLTDPRFSWPFPNFVTKSIATSSLRF